MKCARILDAYKFDYPERDIPEINDDQVLLKNNYLGVAPLTFRFTTASTNTSNTLSSWVTRYPAL
jgi:NADPH-dependent curcumin reductase CurA